MPLCPWPPTTFPHSCIMNLLQRPTYCVHHDSGIIIYVYIVLSLFTETLQIQYFLSFLPYFPFMQLFRSGHIVYATFLCRLLLTNSTLSKEKLKIMTKILNNEEEKIYILCVYTELKIYFHFDFY